jgi:hypothetical protein
VLLRLVGTSERPDGSPSSGGVSAAVELSSSEFREVSLHTDARGCLVPPAGGPGRSTAAAGLTWTLAARLLTATEDSATVDVRWARRQTDVGAGTAAPFEESRRVVLHEGGLYPLDVLRTPDAGYECTRVTIQLGFELIDGGPVADAVLRYDMWLVHRDAAGGEITDHVQASGRQGQQTTYIFAPVHHASDGRVLAARRSDGIETEVSGTLRGRVRADGSVVLGVQTWRSVTPGGRSGGLGNGGMKELTVRAGETIEVALPPVSGQVGGQDMSRLFHGQSTSIRITTTRLR